MRKRILPLAVFLCLAAAAREGSELSQVRAVYVLSMSNGFDQYLANQLAAHGVFQVVTDPKKADAIFTDQIGPRFEHQIEELYPPPPPAAPEEPKAEARDEAEAAAPASAEVQSVREEFSRFSSFSRGRGNLFLVHRESRQVIWSIHERPKNSTPSELNRTAAKVAAKLKDSLGGK